MLRLPWTAPLHELESVHVCVHRFSCSALGRPLLLPGVSLRRHPRRLPEASSKSPPVHGRRGRNGRGLVTACPVSPSAATSASGNAVQGVGRSDDTQLSGADQAPAESGSECGDSECRPSPTRFSSEQGGGEPQCDAANGGSGDPVRCVATTHELVGIDPTRSDF